MSFFIGVLTFFLVVNCAVLILLVLIQLPKKDAGAGLAFGGGAADALFGAGFGQRADQNHQILDDYFLRAGAGHRDVARPLASGKHHGV